MKSLNRAAAPANAGRFNLHRGWTTLVIAVAALVMIPGLWSTHLWDEDEGYFAAAAAEMFERGDWIVPTFNHELFGHKPPLMYWGMMAGFHALGVNELAARLPSALCGILASLVTMRIGQRLFNDRAGAIAGMVLGSCVMFSVVSRAATPDAHLTLFSVLAIYLFVRAAWPTKADLRGDNNGPMNIQMPRDWQTWAAIYGVLGLAVLTKGPIGVLFPAASIGLFLMLQTPVANTSSADAAGGGTWWSIAKTLGRRLSPFHFLRTAWQMRPITGLLFVVLIAGPWFVLVEWKTNGQFLREFIGTHHLQRFSTSMDNHSGGFWYYPASCLIGLFPWSVFAIPTLMNWFRTYREQPRQRAALLLVTSWATVYLVIFSLARTKLPNYVLPAYPALALMTGHYLDGWLSRTNAIRSFWPRVSFATMLAVGLLLIGGIQFAAGWQFAGQTLLDKLRLHRDLQVELGRIAWLALPLVAAGVVALVCAIRQQLNAALIGFAAFSIGWLALLWNVAAPWIDRYQSPQQIVLRIKSQHDHAHVDTFRFLRPTMVFYLRDAIREHHAAKTAATEFLADRANFLITTSDQYPHLAEHLVGDEVIVDRQMLFPTQRELLVLARPAKLAKQAERPRR